MATIEREAIRASITIGNTTISTPDVMSFNVKKSRGQMAATFSASLKMDASTMTSNSLSLVNEGVVIEAGVKGRENTIFTGKVQKCTVNPIRTNASKVAVSLAGKDSMSIMEGQKINRRIKTYRDGEEPPERWGVITALEEDNTPVESGFGLKTFSKKRTAIYDTTNLTVAYTPEAYALNKAKDEFNAAAKPIGAVTATKKEPSGAGGSF